MSENYLIVSIAILNLLLAASGLLLTYFDWSAARRREFLYLFFAEDRPGVSYFAAARQRRSQYTRLLIGFILVFVIEFVIANLFVSMNDDVQQLHMWVRCLRILELAALGQGFLYDPDAGRRGRLDVVVTAIVILWMLFTLVVVRISLSDRSATRLIPAANAQSNSAQNNTGRPENEGGRAPQAPQAGQGREDTPEPGRAGTDQPPRGPGLNAPPSDARRNGATPGTQGAPDLQDESRRRRWRFRDRMMVDEQRGSENAQYAAQLVQWGSLIARIALVGLFIYLIRRRGQNVAQGLLQSNPSVLSAAFLLWIINPLAGLLMSDPGGDDSSSLQLTVLILSQLAAGLSFLLLVMLVARGVLMEYEAVESSRHRLARERYVIFSFLRRIGAAFTTAVEVDKVLHIILESGLETTEASAGAIFLYRPETGLLEPRVTLHFFPPMYVDTPAAKSERRSEELEEEMKHQSFRLGEGIIGQVAQEGRARMSEDVRADGIMLGTTTDFMRNRSMLVVPLKIRDEPLGVMAVLNKGRGSFGTEDQSLLQALADQGALSINNAMLTHEVAKQARLRRELQIAREIQRMLLPERCPIVPGFDLGAQGSSATEVGGDYYDFFWVDKDRLGIVVADVSGKGVPAALTVAMMRSVFRTQARGNNDVRDVLSQVNNFMAQDLRSRDFITCIYGILEIPTRRFSWGRAGHEPIIVAHQSGPTDVLSPSGFALGVIESPEFDEMLDVETLQLKPGDRVLIFTDGLTEAMNANGEEFGMERILEVMNRRPRGNGTAPNAAYPNGYADDGAAKADGSRDDNVPVGDGLADGSGSTAAGGATVVKTRLRLSDRSPCAPEDSPSEPEDLKALARAVRQHVDEAPQSDDLTIVYLSVK